MSPTLPITAVSASKAMREEQEKKGNNRMTPRGAIVALSYMAFAVLLVMFNKAALSSYEFPCANVITVMQMILSTVVLYVLRKLNLIKFSDDSADGKTAVKHFVPVRVLRQISPLSIAYLFYMVVGMASIRGVNVPMYTTLRRTTVFFTIIMEFLLVGQKHSNPIIASVAIIVLGAFVAGSRDLSFELEGYSTVLLSNITTAIYLATIARLGKTTGLNSFGLMWCNGLICGPILILWTLLSGELNMAINFESLHVLGFQVVTALSCIIAFCLNYTIFLNTTLNSALTQTMCGNLKDLGTVFFGWICFGGLPFDWLNVFGQFLGFLGSGMYAYCKLKGK
ncbi:unnamed protein product [Sphagnum jensenii]|uniref:Sugar phosphate transporter domain-containing protein n=1 Tax=Sphagnum jensenii TaxID=128206 RepID=A0ABP0WJG3_9BRYO